jgi:hypothetical protein
MKALFDEKFLSIKKLFKIWFEYLHGSSFSEKLYQKYSGRASRVATDGGQWFENAQAVA